MAVPASPADPDLLAELLELAEATAAEAGELLVAALDSPRIAVDTKSTPTDMVTEMDRRSELLIGDRLLRARPRDGILGEEGSSRPGTSGVRWVVDPLDGTTNYVYRLPGWNVSIGAEVDGVPVVGAVAVPSHGDLFAAALGRGATRNGVPIRIPDPPAPLRTSLVGTGFGYDPAVREVQAQALVRLLPRIRDIRRGGAAATDLCSLACGRFDAYYERGLAPWDHTAGSVIAREAGARVETWTDGPWSFTVGAHPARFDELVALLHEVGATPPG